MSYIFREVICPYCDHRFMFNQTEGGISFHIYYDNQTNRPVNYAICPLCGKTVFALDNQMQGATENDDRIEQRGNVRGL